MVKYVTLALCGVALFALTSEVLPQSKTDERSTKNKIGIMRYVWDMGIKFDCYFTLEWRDGDKPHFFNKALAENDDIETLPQMMAWIQRELPDVEAAQDSQNPVVIHLRTNSVKKSANHALDEKITIQYDDRLNKLPDAIGRFTVSKIVYGGLETIPSATPDDRYTSVHVVAKDQVVRNILSDFMPLSQFAPSLWIAVLREDDRSSKVRVSYFGPIGDQPFSGDPRDKTVIYSFTDARNAYFLNPLSGKLVGEAAKFITDGFASGKTRNVRWSMYYLGKHKVESAIPLLLSHLAYRYTTVPVLAEAYPAVHALLDMGKLANAPVQKQLETETDPLRLQLLCAVLLGVNGAKDGRRLTTETASKLSDTQKKRIMNALTAAEGLLIAVPPFNDVFPPPADLVEKLNKLSRTPHDK